MTGALLDRLTHRVNIIELKGDSYRLKTSLKRQEGSGIVSANCYDEVDADDIEEFTDSEEDDDDDDTAQESYLDETKPSKKGRRSVE